MNKGFECPFCHKKVPNDNTINQSASALGKISHQKNPRSKEFMSEIGKKGAKKRWAK